MMLGPGYKVVMSKKNQDCNFVSRKLRISPAILIMDIKVYSLFFEAAIYNNVKRNSSWEYVSLIVSQYHV